MRPEGRGGEASKPFARLPVRAGRSALTRRPQPAYGASDSPLQHYSPRRAPLNKLPVGRCESCAPPLNPDEPGPTQALRPLHEAAEAALRLRGVGAARRDGRVPLLDELQLQGLDPGVHHALVLGAELQGDDVPHLRPVPRHMQVPVPHVLARVRLGGQPLGRNSSEGLLCVSI